VTHAVAAAAGEEVVCDDSKRLHAAVRLRALLQRDLLQTVRLNRARMLIESSRMSIESVAEQVGYSDATALRRLTRKVAGSNPSRYRTAVSAPLDPGR